MTDTTGEAVDIKVEWVKGGGDMGVYQWKGGAEATPERVRCMRLSRVLATIVLCTMWLPYGGGVIMMTHQNNEGGN